MADTTPTSSQESATFNALIEFLRDRLAPPAELLTRETFAALLDVGVSTFDRQRETGVIGPRPMRLAGVKWNRAEVMAWLRHRGPDGELFDSKTWPAVWESLRRRLES